MKPISKSEFSEAFAQGVAAGLAATAAEITKSELLGAIREGVHDAVWSMITNATSAPCQDFFAAVEDGVTAAMVVLEKKNLAAGSDNRCEAKKRPKSDIRLPDQRKPSKQLGRNQLP